MCIETLVHKEPKSIISIVGPTCTGKTSLSIDLASSLDLEIINADSRLIFAEMNIGTAKPSLEERRGIKHHLLDIAQPDAVYSSGEYQKDFDELLTTKFGFDLIDTVDDNFASKDFAAKHKALDMNSTKTTKPKLIVAGGTGMYLRAALENLDMPNVSQDFELRAELDARDLGDLCDDLKDLDPEAHARMDLHNKRRVVRALEVIKLSGQKYSEQSSKKSTDRYDVLWIGLKFKDRALQYDYINKRVHQMISDGLLAEVEALYQRYGKSKTLSNTIGYGEIIQYLEKEITLDEAVALIQKKTRNYAKRQLTWFNSNPRINWFYVEETLLA